jgi:hypothetical protein
MGGGGQRLCARRLAIRRRAEVAVALMHLAPKIPRFEREAVLDHGETSVGLSTAAPEVAAWLSMVAFIRHSLTDYDALLAEGYDRDSARFFVLEATNAILAEWGSRRFIEDAEAEPE